MVDEQQKYFSYVTNIGNALIANAAVKGEKVNFSHLAVGDGGGDYYKPTRTMTALKNEVWRGRVNDVSPYPPEGGEAENQPGKDYELYDLYITAILPADVGGFVVREMAIFDSDNRMIAICNTPAIEKSIIGDGAPTGITLTMHIIVSNIENINITVDMTVIYATKQDLARHNRAPDAHENRFAAIEAMHDLIRIDHHLNCHPLLMVGKLQYGMGMGSVAEGPLGGTAMEQIAARALYHDRDSLTVRTVKSVIDLGAPILHQLAPTLYTVTFEGNDADSVQIELYPPATQARLPGTKQNGGKR